MRLPTLAVAVALSVPLASTAAAGYLVVVHADHPGEAVDRATLSQIFLRKAVSWGDGSAIRPVDQSLRSKVRAEFSEDALHLSILAVKSYWQRELSTGRSRPPAVKSTDAEVLEYVAATPGSIGYVTAGARLGAGVKALGVVE